MNKDGLKKVERENQGVTLIALIITIIVLLILAGISLTALIGNNGVLNQAINASVQTDIADVKEQIQMDILAKQMETGDYDSITEDDFKEILEKYGTLSGTDEGDEEQSLLDQTLTTEKGNEIPVKDIYSNIKTPSNYITAQDVLDDPATYYGQVVETGGSKGSLNEDYEWEIFYSDGTNIYLITEDYINYNDAPEKNGNAISHSSNSYTQNCYWSSSLYGCYDGYKGESSYEHSDDYCWNLLFCGRYLNNTCTYTNMKCVSYMLDEEIWENKFSCQFQSGAVEYIIGGPTVEKFCQAYNEYHDAGGCSCGALGDLGCLVESSSSYGYKVSLGDSTSIYKDTGCESCKDCNFLFIRDTSKAYGMWLASPSAYHSYYVMYARCSGSVAYHDCNYAYYRVSPASFSKI